MNYRQEACTLVQNLDQRMNLSVYDIAWMARLEPFQDLLEWMLENQHPDGSWGGAIPYYHDRIICTLASMIALQERGHPKVTRAIHKAEVYLWHHLHMLETDPFELSGFELIFPTMLIEARQLGLDVPVHTCGYSEIQTAKLKLIPPEMLYSPLISTVYSLEFLGRGAKVDQLRVALASNGSLGDSPATTAFYLLLAGEDERALEYLRTVQKLSRVITVYPFQTFEFGWVLNNLFFSGLPLETFGAGATCAAEKLHAVLTPEGFALDPSFRIADGDITSVCCGVLARAGYDIDPAILAQFETKDHVFRTYRHERNLSVSTNVHALDALRSMPDYPHRDQVREAVIVQLLEARKYGIYWTDKWHASPYYATTHAVMSLLQENNNMAKMLDFAMKQTVEWLVHTQFDDGSWGFFEQGTVEETAYVLTALIHYRRKHALNVDILHRAAAFIEANGGTAASFPELWLAKSNYAPYDIIRAAVLTALILYDEEIGG